MALLPGFATAAATQVHAGRFEAVQHGVLGRTGLRSSQAGFGCYRVADGVRGHRQALQLALERGINLIDTSTNYADGDSETLVGKVLTEGVRSGTLHREEIIVVSKAGYLQGRNYALSQDRKAGGRPFPDLVPYTDGLEHCIHPEFLEDQINRSLERLNLATLDVFLLHNPEYYLNWAAGQGIPAESARVEYDRRLRKAFRFLEQAADQGRLRYYGISSNTFPAAPDRKDFTCLQRVLEIAAETGPGHRFALIQFPMNLFESGAVLTANQPDGATLLAAARRANLGTLVNRPLNAIISQGLLRLADVDIPRPRSAEAIDPVIRELMASETALVREILPGLAVPEGLRAQMARQVAVAAPLLARARQFPSYDAWCQVRDSQLLPRIDGVLSYIEGQPATEILRTWSDGHRRRLAEVLEAVTSFYAAPAAARSAAIKAIVQKAHPDWQESGTLSQVAIRALRTTSGISAVLVGMRRASYVHDVLRELGRFKTLQSHERGWQRIEAALEKARLSP